MDLLTGRRRFTSDSDGRKVSAARRPVFGADKVGRLILGLMRRAGDDYRFELAMQRRPSAGVVLPGSARR